MKTQQGCTTPRDVAVTAEVSINLPGKRIRTDEHGEHVRGPKLAVERRIREDCTIVSDDALADEP